MQALLSGFAAVAPRSTTLNLVEVLSTLVSRYPTKSKAWMTDILYSVSRLCFAIGKALYSHVAQPTFTPSKATDEAKDKFIKTIFGFVGLPY
jgi:hypothetical protein